MCSPVRSARGQVLAELAELVELAGSGAGSDAGGLGAADLMEQVAGLAGFIGQLQGELARLSAALDGALRVGGARDAGYASAAAFLRTGCGLAPARASELVTAGRGLARLAATEKALAAGEISFDEVLVVARTAADIRDERGAAVAAGQDPQADGQPDPQPGDEEAGEQVHERVGVEAAAGAAERVLLDAAAGGVSVAQLRRLGEEVTYRAAPGAAEERERRRWERRYLSFGLTLDSTGTLSGACGDTVTFEIIRTAAEAFGPPGGALDTRTAAQRRLDGLAAACRTALDTGSAPIRHRAAPHISVLVHDHTLTQAAGADAARGQAARAGHATRAGQPDGAGRTPAGGAAQVGPSGATGPDPAAHGAAPAPADAAAQPAAASGASSPGTGADTATAGAGGGGGGGDTGSVDGAGGGGGRGAPPGRSGHGAMLTATQVLALCCGAEITAIRWDDGLPLDVGRAARTEPPALRKALEARDRRCRWPGCETPAAWTTAHHIPGWAHGARTSTRDLVLLCHLHHTCFIHQHGWTITGNPAATLHFTSPATTLTLHSPLPGKARAP